MRRYGGMFPTGGGGSGGSGNVAWTPGYAEDPMTVNVAVDLENMAFATIMRIGIGAAEGAGFEWIDKLKLENTSSLGVDFISDLGYLNSRTIGINVDIEDVRLKSTQTVGIGTATGSGTFLDKLGLLNDKSLGVHMSGTVVGAPFYQDVSTYNSPDQSASIPVPVPAGTVSGDFLLVFIGYQNSNDPTFTDPGGWTFIREDKTAGGVSGVGLRSYWRISPGSEPASYTWTMGALNNGVIASMHRVNAVDQTTPVNVSGGQTASATDPVAPDITTTVANCLKFCACVQSNVLNADYTAPANYVERTDQNGNTALGALSVTGETATRVQAAAAASGTAIMDSSQLVASNYASQHIAIAPGTLIIAS